MTERGDHQRAGHAVSTRSVWRSAGALVLGGTGYSIVGVMPRAFTSAAIDVWLPAQTPPGPGGSRRALHERRRATGRQASRSTGRRRSERRSNRHSANGIRRRTGWSVTVGDPEGVARWRVSPRLTLVFGAVALLLAIAIASIAGPHARPTRHRRRELSIRRRLADRADTSSASLMRKWRSSRPGAAAGGAGAHWLVRAVRTSVRDRAAHERAHARLASARVQRRDQRRCGGARVRSWPAMHARTETLRRNSPKADAAVRRFTTGSSTCSWPVRLR